LTGLYGDLSAKGKKGGKNAPAAAQLTQEEQDKLRDNQEKKDAILSEINYEATLFGVFLVNLIHLASFIFMSFVVVRFWSTNW